jgi:ABC-type uncharacterized transport system involved in gliding motility auxiliary subunit
MMLDFFSWAGLAGLALTLVSAGAYAVRGSLDVWVWTPLVLGIAGIAAYLSRHASEARKAVVSRRARYGANSVVLVLAVLAVLAFGQAILSNHNKSWDLTKNKANSLADETVKTVRALKQEVTLYCFFAENQMGEYEGLVKKVKDLNPSRLKFEFVNPNKRPLLAQQYSVKAFGSTAVVSGASQELITTTREEDLVNAILKVTSGQAKTLYFLKGHGELPLEEAQDRSGSEFKRALENSHYEVKDLNLVQEQKIPDDCSVLVVAGPQVDLIPGEIALFDGYLARGGRMLVMADPRRPLKNLGAFLVRAGAKLGNDLVVDPLSRLITSDPLAPAVQNFDASHPIVKDMHMQVVLPMTRSVDEEAKLPEGVKATVLARSLPDAWGYSGGSNRIPGKPGPADTKGPVPLAVALEIEPRVFGGPASSTSTAKAEMVVYGTSLAFSNQGLGIFNNQDLGVNSVRWLTQDESHISIKPRDQENVPLILPQSRMNLIWLLSLVGLPGIVLATGIVVAIRRKREAA